jgi:hypothetical protein
MSFNASKWLWKVPNPNFSNWDIPLKWPSKLIPPVFSTHKVPRYIKNYMMMQLGSIILGITLSP